MANGIGLEVAISPEFKPIIEKVAVIVHKISGNKYGEKQSFMIESRVKKRMMELGIKSPDEYIKFIENNKAEVNTLVSLMTTHHTFFFREFAHFELLSTMLPEIVNSCKKRGDRTVHIWSAACSRGHEVYSLAMFMEFFLPKIDPTMSYKILGSDIDTESVRIATNGVYHHNELKEIPMDFLGEHWSKGSGEILLYSKAKKHIRAKCEFKVGNLLNVKEIVPSQKFDIIFCRNVFIYFEPFQIESITKELLKTMHPTGVFFSGMSESLMSMKLDITSVGPSVYVKSENAPQKTPTITPKPLTQAPVPETVSVSSKPKVQPTAPKILDTAPNTVTDQAAKCYKVLCVDDSPSILTMLKKILSADMGFEVVATASNGKEAAEKLKQHQVDLMTLDIHMPEMDGISYLKTHFKKGHPPVMMVSSASREDSDVAVEALKSGASDYVEKPMLANLEERGDEIRTKLRTMGALAKRGNRISSMDRDFQTKISIDKPETKLRLIIASFSDLPKIIALFSESACTQPPTIILLEGHGEVLGAVVDEHKTKFKQKVYHFNETTKNLEVDSIYFGDARKMMKTVQQDHGSKMVSILCYGITSKWVAKEVTVWKMAHILMEDFGESENKRSPLFAKATDVVPATSFYYMSNRFLGKK